MKASRFIAANFVLVVILFQKAITSSGSALEYQKRAVAAQRGVGPMKTRSSFSNDINQCHFGFWPANILNGEVACEGKGSQQLCYGGYSEETKDENGQKLKRDRALFAVCYDTGTLIPRFTGHILQKGGETKAPEAVLNKDDQDEYWISDETLGDQVATDEDYKKNDKAPEYDSARQKFLARGHLSPDGDFSKGENGEFYVTYTTTNCAPQWQPFNGGNWKALENAIRDYSKQRQRELYIFSGTGGRAKYKGKDVILNGRVLTPKYYWKAVCDPDLVPPTGKSIVFVAENNFGDDSEDRVLSSDPRVCSGITQPQTKKKGVLQCYSLADAKTSVPDIAEDLPPFGRACQPEVRSDFLDSFLNRKNKGVS